MSFPYDRFLQLIRRSQGTFSKRLREQTPVVEPRLDLLPKLDPAKVAEIDQIVTDLNRQVLTELEQPDQGRVQRPKG